MANRRSRGTLRRQAGSAPLTSNVRFLHEREEAQVIDIISADRESGCVTPNSY